MQDIRDCSFVAVLSLALSLGETEVMLDTLCIVQNPFHLLRVNQEMQNSVSLSLDL